MKYLLVVFVLVNLCIFASALDRTKLLHKHSRKHARGSDTQANAGSSNAASTVASAAGAASQVAAATTKVAESAKQAVTSAVTDKAATTDKASTQTTSQSQSQSQTQAAAATNAAAATTTTKQTTTSTTSTQTTTAAQDKTKILDTKAKTFDGRAIEHVTKEPAPAGMVRPVLVPPPDAIPSTFTVRPHIEGEREGQHAAPLPASAATHMVPVEDASSPSSQTTPLPQFTQAQDGSSSKDSKDSKWWGYGGSKSGGSVTAQEVSSLDADEPEDNFPPKYPPCSENECVIQVPAPPCCSVTPPPPYTHGYWWHHKKGGKHHVHVHMHTAAESPEQISEENAQAAREDAEVHAAGSDDESSPPPQDESASESGGEDGDEEEPTDEEGESQAGEDDEDNSEAVEGDTVEGQQPDGSNNNSTEESFVPSSTGSSGETTDDSVTVTVSMVNTLIADALSKSHEQIVAELTARLDAVQATHATNEEQLAAQVQSFKTDLETLKTTVEGFVNKQGIPGPRGPKGDKGDPATIILHDHHHHHHHHHHDDDDEDGDDDDDDADDDDDDAANPFTSTGASTIDLLKSMEAASEDLTNKMDQADVLDAAAGDDDDDDDSE